MGAATRSSMQYLEEVESFFLTLRGRGLMLSPSDVELVRELESDGAPAEVVCRGIARAFAARRGPHERPVRSVRGCLSFIEGEIALWRRKEVGRNDWDAARDARWAEARLHALLERIASRGRAADGIARAYHRGAYRAVRELAGSLGQGAGRERRALKELAAIESRLLAETAAALPGEQAAGVERRARARVALRRDRVSERAYAAALAHAREAELRETLGLVPLTLEER